MNSLIFQAVLVVGLVSCFSSMIGCSESSRSSSSRRRDITTMPDELVIGLIPTENNEEMIQRFGPMQSYLKDKLGREVRVFTATDYASVIEAMRNQRVDIALFGPFSYVLAEREAGAEAFAVGVEGSQKTYKSIFIVPGSSPAETLYDLQGKKVAFVDPASTSGGLVPTYLTKKITGKLPQEFFAEVIYVGSHDAAELAVKNKVVDAAACADITHKKMLEQGVITADSNRILLQSDPLPSPPFAYSKDLDSATKKTLRDLFLQAHTEIEVSGYGNITRYQAASPSDYKIVHQMLQELGLSKEQMPKRASRSEIKVKHFTPNGGAMFAEHAGLAVCVNQKHGSHPCHLSQ